MNRHTTKTKRDWGSSLHGSTPPIGGLKPSLLSGCTQFCLYNVLKFVRTHTWMQCLLSPGLSQSTWKRMFGICLGSEIKDCEPSVKNNLTIIQSGTLQYESVHRLKSLFVIKLRSVHRSHKSERVQWTRSFAFVHAQHCWTGGVRTLPASFHLFYISQMFFCWVCGFPTECGLKIKCERFHGQSNTWFAFHRQSSYLTGWNVYAAGQRF